MELSASAQKLPKILVISATPISSVDATGITLVNLFKGWPIDRIAQIYDSPHLPDLSICGSALRFSNSENGIVRNSKKLRNFVLRSLRKLNGLSQRQGTSILNNHNGFSLLAAISDVSPFMLPNTLAKWVEEYQPEVIYTLLGNSRMCALVNKISRRHNIPVIPHFMDDWPTTLYQSLVLGKAFEFIAGAKLAKTLSYSNDCLAIGSEMAKELSKRYQKNFDYFMNCVACSPYVKPCRAKSFNGIRLGYVGGLHLNRWRTLLMLAEATNFFTDTGSPITLEIYAPSKDVLEHSYKFASFDSNCKFFSAHPDQVEEILRSFDVLVHVESFMPSDSAYTRLSVSTKIPQYMAAGRPILAIGPAGLSSISYVKEVGAGLTVEEEGVSASLLDALRQLLESDKVRETMALKGYDNALISHNAALERARFVCFIAANAFRGRN